MYTKQWYQHPVNQIRNISVLQKLHLKIASETTQEAFVTKKFVNSTELSKYMWKLKDENITANIKWNMSMVHGTPKGGVSKLCLTDKFWLLKDFSDNIYSV